MKFLIDANLPAVLAKFFEAEGYVVIHTSSLPKGNSTQDNEILDLVSDYVVVTKDSDFYQSFLFRRVPYKLIYVKVGNLKAKELFNLFGNQTKKITALLEQHDCIEVHKDKIIIID
ncbi:MAG: DUF5615 family PIN-like protein [Bacteroidota bacterium]